MRRRAGFTLIEMMVSVALVLFIMVILTEAFGKGLESFRTLKAIGDMESRLRAATDILRRDLAADHFEGKRRLSDPVQRWQGMGVPLVGFFRMEQNASATTSEGDDADLIAYWRGLDSLYFTVKLRGNNRSEFFQANLAPVTAGDPASPLLNPAVRSTFFDQPSDARFQDTPNSYASQWAEVLYVPIANGTTTPGGDPLYTLFRGQLVVVADNSRLNWASTPPNGCPIAVPQPSMPVEEQHKEMSCYRKEITSGKFILYFNNPSDLVSRSNRTFAKRPLAQWPLMPVLTDVVSFKVEQMPVNGEINPAPGNNTIDTENWGAGGSGGNPIRAVRITIRVWDAKTRQTRQITVIQDM